MRALNHFAAVLLFSCAAIAGTGATDAQASTARTLSFDRLTVTGCSFPNFSFEAALRKAHELGFAGVEIAVFTEKQTNYGETYPCAVVDELSTEEKVRLKALVGKFKHVSAHLPYGPDLRPLAADKGIREKSRRELHRALDDAGFWGAELANIHVMSEPGVSYAAAKADLVVLYRELADHAAKLKLRLSIEVTRPYGMADYFDLVKSIDRENVGGTVDTGHMNFYRPELAVEGAARQTPAGVRRYNDLIAEFVAGLGPKLFHLHLDDVRAVDWREHFVPGDGILDWPRLFAQLNAMNYRGLLAVEILYYSGAQDSGAQQKRVFSEKTREGAPTERLARMREFFLQTGAFVPR